jgi:outer membrane protein
MKKGQFRIAHIFLAMAVLFSFASAQTKLGIVNSQEVLEKSSEGKKIIARIQEADKQNQAALARLDEDIRALQTKLSSQRLTLSEEAAVKLSADLDKKNTERKRTAEDAYASMNELRDRLFRKLQDELLSVVAQIGKEKSFDLILDLGKSGAAYWNPAIDLSAEVIKRYDASKTPAK